MTLPEQGRGARVALAHKRAGECWQIVDLRSHKPQIAAALAKAEYGVSATGKAGTAAESQEESEAGSGSDADSEELVYKGPSGWIVKRRAASAKVYGIKHRADKPVSGRVQRMRGVYKRSWVLQTPAP